MQNKSIIGIIVAVVVLALVVFLFGNKSKKGGAEQITGSIQELSDGRYALDTGKVSWEGEKKTGKHNGEVSVTSGSLVVNNKKVTKGEVVADMNSLTVADLTEAEENKKLSDHLKSDDFFASTKNPTAKIVVKDWSTNNAVSLVTVRGVEKEITHPIILTQNPDGTVFVKSTLVLQNADFGVGQSLALKAILNGNFTVSFEGTFATAK